MTELSAKQNTIAAKIFLNTFGYVLDESIKYLTFYLRPKIINKDGNNVGELYFRGNVAHIVVNDGSIKLNASYKLPKVSGGCWQNDINFSLNNDGDKITGNYLLSCAVSDELGLLTDVGVSLKCKTKDNEEINLDLFNKGKFFYSQVVGANMEEVIVNIWDQVDPCFYTHTISSGEKDDLGIYKNQIKSLIGRDLSRVKEHNRITYANITLVDKEIVAYNHKAIQIKNDSYYEKLIEIADYMRVFDGKAIDAIYMLQKHIRVGKISLLQNLCTVCYDQFPDNVIYALLGIKKDPSIYQDDVSNLTEAYFGKEEKTDFPKILKNYKKK